MKATNLLESHFLQPYMLCLNLGVNPKVFRSMKLSKGLLMANRYYLEFNDQDREEIKKNLAMLEREMNVPLNYLDLAKSQSESELSFIGVEASAKSIEYRFYFNFDEKQELRNAFAIHWIKGAEKAFLKSYDELYLDDVNQIFESLDKNPQRDKEFSLYATKILSKKGISNKVFKVQEEATGRLSYDVSIPHLIFEEIAANLREISAYCKVSEQFKKWFNSVDKRRSLARFAVGVSDSFFITVYVEDDRPKWFNNNEITFEVGRVFVIGQLNYRFVDRKSKELLTNELGRQKVNIPEELIKGLIERPELAHYLCWVVEINGMPLYVIDISGVYADVLLLELVRTMGNQIKGTVDKFNLGGQTLEKTVLLDNVDVQLISVDTRCIYAWHNFELVKQMASDDHIAQYLGNLLLQIEPVTYNYGKLSRERALNYLMVNLSPLLWIAQHSMNMGLFFERLTVDKLSHSEFQVNLIFILKKDINKASTQFSVRIDTSDTLPTIRGKLFFKHLEKSILMSNL
jgi:hypothetical protein